MNDEDQKLKEIFRREIEGLVEDTPDFKLMTGNMAVKPDKGNPPILRIAAIIILIVVAGALIIVKNQDNASISYSVTRWIEPTRDLMTISSSENSVTISNWTSPTNFLLMINNQQIKN